MTSQTTSPDIQLASIDFGGMDDNQFQVHGGGDLNETLGLAVDLGLAVTSLCDRLDFHTNNNGDPVTCAELRALGFLSGTATALMQQIRYGIRRAQEASQ